MKIASNVWLLSMAAALLATAAGLSAQELPVPPVVTVAGTTNPVMPSRIQAREQRLEQLTATLGLSSNQQSQIRAILDAQDGELAQQQGSAKARKAELSDAVKAGDQASQERLRREANEASGRQVEIYRKYSQAIMDVMTPEQRQASQVDGVYQSLINGRLRSCDLSEEQKARVRKLCEQAVGALASTGAVTRVDFAKLNAEVEASVLTPDQRDQALAQPVWSRVLRELRGCGLTPDQEARVRALCLEAAKAAKAAAGEGARRPGNPIAVARDVSEKVRKTILTDAQRLDLDAGRLYEPVAVALRGCALSSGQEARVRQLCREAAAGAAETADYNTRSGAQRDLLDKIKGEVLTEAQRAEMAQPRETVQVLPVDVVTNEVPRP